MAPEDKLTEVLAENARLKMENAMLRALVKKLEARIAKLEARLDQSTQELQEAARQAARFRRRETQKVKDKKRCGRKGGHRGAYRPEPQHVDHHIEQELECCPKCKESLTDLRRLTQFIEEIPPIRPVVTRLVTWSGRCAKCGMVRSTHPLQTSHAQGAAGTLLGPRAVALAVLLNKHNGVTQRKTCKILKQGFGLSLTSGGLSQLLDRAAKKMSGKYEELISEIRGSPGVHADETSWYVGRPGYWLWVFSTPEATLYHVASSRGHPVAKQILGEEFKNVLITDCAPAYNRFKCPRHLCIAHHQKVIKQERELSSTHDPTYLDACARFFRDVVELAHARDESSSEECAARHELLKGTADALMSQKVKQRADRKIQNRMKRCGAGLLGCLIYDVDPTNNLAERDLRPAVIARKVSCGNKTEQGARTTEILMSLAATAQKRGRDFLSEVAEAVRIPVTAVPVG